MAEGNFARGGTNLRPKPFEVKMDPASGLVQPSYGISVFSRPDHLERFGGAYRIANLPEDRIVNSMVGARRSDAEMGCTL
jgi:hypothetical protein